MIIKKTIALILIACSFSGFSINIPEAPSPHRYVNDYAFIFTEIEKESLEKRILDFEEKTSNQIAIVTVKSLGDIPPSEYAYAIGEKWGVGDQTKDNGIVLLIKPKYPNEKGQVYISIGYGLEGAIPDSYTKRIIENILIPHFKNNDSYTGVNKALTTLMALSKGTYIGDIDKRYYPDDYTLHLVGIILFILFLPFIYAFVVTRRKVPEEYSIYYYEGEVSSENIISQIEKLELALNKKHNKLKRFVSKLKKLNKKQFSRYESLLERSLFVIKLNGENRYKVFWRMSDPFFKLILLGLFIVMISISVILLNESYFLASFIFTIFAFSTVLFLIRFLVAFLGVYEYALRKKGKSISGISISIFAINALIKGGITKKINPKTGLYTYAIASSVAMGSAFGGGSSFGGGFGGGGGGFGGGSFGGGGAGGSW